MASTPGDGRQHGAGGAAASSAGAAHAAIAIWLVVLMLLAPVLVSVAHPLSPSAAAQLGAELFAVLWCLLGALAALHAGRSVLARPSQPPAAVGELGPERG